MEPSTPSFFNHIASGSELKPGIAPDCFLVGPEDEVNPLILCDFDFASSMESAVLNSFVDSQDHDGLQHQLPSPTPNPNPNPSPAPPQPSEQAAPASNRSHQHRAKRRRCTTEVVGHQAPTRFWKNHAPKATPIHTSIDAHNFPASAGAYSAAKGPAGSPTQEDSIQQLVAAGFTLVEWDATTSRPIADKTGRIVAVLVSPPKGPDFADACRRVFKLMEVEGAAVEFSKADTVHKRGRFPAVNIGVTHGQGGDRPVNLLSGHIEMLERLLGNRDFQRMASFADSAFACWGPGLYKHYRERLVPLWERYPHLRRNFTGSIYPTAAFNFGPRVRTHPHRDHLNCPYGWCAVQAFGSFDPKRGGHLILWELKLVVEFPSKSLILLPSAAITHSNTPVGPSETRTSFTQYCPGAILRYVDNGMSTDKDLKLRDKKRYDKRMEERKDRWTSCIELLPTLKSLGL